jgi:hypothetical protein
MWWLILVIYTEFDQATSSDVIGTYKGLDQCVIMQNTVQPVVTEKDPNGLVLCTNNYKEEQKALK